MAHGSDDQQAAWQNAAPEQRALLLRPVVGTRSKMIKAIQPINSSQRTSRIVRSGNCQTCCMQRGKLVPV